MDWTFGLSAFVTLFVVIDPIGLAPLFVALTAGETDDHRRHVAVRACIVAFGILTLFGLAGEQVLGFVGISMPAFRIAGGILLFITALDMLFERRTARRQRRATPQEETPGQEMPGQKATGQKATGQKATGQKATGQKATGQKTTGREMPEVQPPAYQEPETAPVSPDPSVFPLAIPLIAGPGAIASMILLVGQAPTAPLHDGQTAVGLLHVLTVHLAMAAVLALALLLFLASGLIERALGETGIVVVTRLLGMLLAALSVQFVLDGLASADLLSMLGGQPVRLTPGEPPLQRLR